MGSLFFTIQLYDDILYVEYEVFHIKEKSLVNWVS